MTSRGADLMSQAYKRSDWYSQSAAKPKKKRTGLKIASIIVCVLVLIVASVYAFSDHFGIADPPAESGSDKDFVWNVPAEPSKNDDGYDYDFRDFFDSYYRSTDETFTGSNLTRGETGTGKTLPIVSAEGREPLSLQALYAACIDSIVGIQAESSGNFGYSWGTGIIMSDDGYILTNEHVIDESDSAKVILSDGTEYSALLIGEDTQTDIAVLKIEASGLPAAEFGDSAVLSVGDPVVAIGNPLGDELTGTMTNGIISAINRDIQFGGRRMTLLQTNAALNEGNSGGPLLNLYGQVIGITNMKMANNYSAVTIEGIGFAIPSTTVKAVTDQLIANGEVVGRPGLGITVGAISEEIAAHYGLPDGLYVTAVSAGSDAEAKGIQVGDILTHVNGREVHFTDDVLEIRDQHAVGDTLTLTVYRHGSAFDVAIVLYDLNNLY